MSEQQNVGAARLEQELGGPASDRRLRGGATAGELPQRGKELVDRHQDLGLPHAGGDVDAVDLDPTTSRCRPRRSCVPGG